MNRPFIALLILAGACGLGGCATVRPWQRGTLADYTMNPGRDPLATAMSEHIYFSREAAEGGREVGGAGCGCN